MTLIISKVSNQFGGLLKSAIVAKKSDRRLISSSLIPYPLITLFQVESNLITVQ